jgi:hypothetical protein
VVTVNHGPQTSISGGASAGIFLHSTPNGGGIVGNAVRDLFIQGGGAGGQAISLGGVLEMTIENIRAIAAFNGVGSFSLYANYNVYVRNCWLEGIDSPYFGSQQLMFGRDVFFGTAGRVTMRHLGGCARWENLFVAFPAPNSECIFKARTANYGGDFTIEGLNVDFEGNSLLLAGIYCEPVHYAPSTTLLLKDIGFGTVGPTTPLVMLKDLGPYTETLLNHCWLSVENLQAYSIYYLAAIDVDGPLWQGEVRGLGSIGPPFNHRQKYGTKTGIVIRETKFVAPPRRYTWYDGAHALEVRSPSDGQFAEWRCVATGTYGTPNPPLWAGLNPLSASPNALACYVQNHAFMTAALQ